MNIILRRRKLGRTSVREISRLSTHGLTAIRNDRGVPEGIDVLVRWGCTDRAPARRTFNSVEAIREVNNKMGFRQLINPEGLCPATWFRVADVPANAYPVVVRPSVHAQGRQLHVCNTVAELRAAVQRYGGGSCYISKLIDKVAEYRVFVVQGRAVCVAQKTPGNPQDVAWNVARGGRFDNVRWDDWPLKAVKTAIAAFNMTSLDFGGVDVMVDGEGNAFVLEINSAPSLTSPYRQECMAKGIDWLITHGRDRIPLVNQKGDYKKFIHPSVCTRARV